MSPRHTGTMESFLRRVGWIAQWIDGTREVYAPHPGSEAGVERFFAMCG